LAKETEVVPERYGKANSWKRVDETKFINLKSNCFKKNKYILRQKPANHTLVDVGLLRCNAM
jgi:hypothetical protein